MAFDFIRVFVNRALALNEGVDEQRALTLGLVGAMVGTPAVGYLVTIATARRDAPPPASTSDETSAVRVPDVTNIPLADAEKKLKPLNLDSAPVEKKSNVFLPGIVISEAPPAGTAVNPGSTVVLTVAKG